MPGLLFGAMTRHAEFNRVAVRHAGACRRDCGLVAASLADVVLAADFCAESVITAMAGFGSAVAVVSGDSSDESVIALCPFVAGFAIGGSVVTCMAGSAASHPASPWRPHHDSSLFEVARSSLAADTDRFLNPPQRPARTPEGYDMLFLSSLKTLRAQGIALTLKSTS